MTTDPKDALPPRLDPACTCICHTQPGVMHVAPCCWEADPRDAEIARLRKMLDDVREETIRLNRATDKQYAQALEELKAERDAALALVAGAYEAAALHIERRHGSLPYRQEIASEIRNLSADALAAAEKEAGDG